MFKLLCILLVTGHALADTVVLNQVVDQALAGLNAAISQGGKDVIPIAALNHNWKYRWHFIKLSGHMNCRDGYAKSLASLRRTGDVVMSTSGNQMTLRVALGLGTLEAGFKHCQFKAKHLFSVTQHISASVSSNSIVAQATLTKNGNECTAHLDSISLDNLGKIKVHTGGGVLHKIEDKLINWIVGHIHGSVVGSINSELQKQAYANFPRADLCSKIPF
ncbi:uncharacterized protein [Halyomorpha halys]|uniref:uncharacterized protein n=1 Tax=Halyomorpha halys TaxID=286706 RepID=UPI0006D4E8DF|nr:uncharacterized protein LOC112210405 [Halyomorpha halys]